MAKQNTAKPSVKLIQPKYINVRSEIIGNGESKTTGFDSTGKRRIIAPTKENLANTKKKD